MRASAAQMAARIGPECVLIEYGSGSSTKTPLLLDQLERPVAYMPDRHLARGARGIRRRRSPRATRPRGPPVCADYTRGVQLPATRRPPARRVAYYPGSTLGNFVPEDAKRFLAQIGEVCGPGGGLLIGADLKKDPLMLHRAYNDALGITAAFNLNILRAAESRARREFRPRPLPPLRLLQPGLRASRDAPGQPGAPDRAHRRVRPSPSSAAKASGPRPRTSTTRTSSPPSPPPRLARRADVDRRPQPVQRRLPRPRLVGLHARRQFAQERGLPARARRVTFGPGRQRGGAALPGLGASKGGWDFAWPSLSRSAAASPVSGDYKLPFVIARVVHRHDHRVVRLLPVRGADRVPGAAVLSER